MAGERFEFLVNEAAKIEYDPHAERFGGPDSTVPDTRLSDGRIIEAKGPTAQYGQFVNSTIDKNIYGRAIVEAFENKYEGIPENNGTITGELCNKWILYYYKNIKQVYKFGYVNKNDKVDFFDPEDFINKHKFKCTYRAKYSGSRPAAKWVDKAVPFEWNCIRKGGRLFAQNIEVKKQTIVRKNPKKVPMRIYVNDEGEVRILSNTKNPTYIFSMCEGKDD